MLVRLQKYLADRGVASRRKCEQYIKEGLVKVNGRVISEMGVKVDAEKDRVEVDEKLRLRDSELVYYALNKPVGYVCSVTGPEKPKIMELLHNIRERIFPVGRLDKLTSGLLLLTNDGRFAYEMTHPKFEKEKEYVVKVRETLDSPTLLKLKESFYIRGRKTQPAQITVQSPHLMRIILREGRNRQIRRMCRRAEITIEKLKRVRIGKLVLGELANGRFRRLTKEEIASLRAAASA